jgi:hypothetical protein
MTPPGPRAIVALAAGGALFMIYFAYLQVLAGRSGFFVLNGVEYAVLLSQLARLVIVLWLPRLRHANLSTLFVVFSFEVILMVPLAALSYLTGDRAVGGAAASLFLSWPAGASIATPPLAIFRVADDIWKGSSAYSVLPSAAAQYGTTVLLVAAVQASSGAFVGLSGLTAAVGSSVVSGGDIVGAVSREFLLPSVILYLSLLAFVSLSRAGRSLDSIVRPLAVLAAGTAAAVLWIPSAGLLTDSSFLLLAAPCALLTFILWWSSRG